MKSFQITCPAKINWTLHIDPIGETNYNSSLHTIHSLMQKLELYDTIRIDVLESEEIAQSKHSPLGVQVADHEYLTLSIHNHTKDQLEAREENLILQAVHAFFAGEQIPRLHIHLEKHIPIGAGLGGGSSDAASTLLLLEQIFGKRDIQSMAKKLGSDVPFFLSEKNGAEISGTGDIVIPKELPQKEHIFLVKPELSISTAWAYEQFDAHCAPLQRGVRGVKNDFEPILFPLLPELQAIYDELKSAEERGLCGSGSTLYGVFQSEEELQKIQRIFEDKGYWVYETKTWKSTRPLAAPWRKKVQIAEDFDELPKDFERYFT